MMIMTLTFQMLSHSPSVFFLLSAFHLFLVDVLESPVLCWSSVSQLSRRGGWEETLHENFLIVFGPDSGSGAFWAAHQKSLRYIEDQMAYHGAIFDVGAAWPRQVLISGMSFSHCSRNRTLGATHKHHAPSLCSCSWWSFSFHWSSVVQPWCGDVTLLKPGLKWSFNSEGQCSVLIKRMMGIITVGYCE